MNDWFTNNKNHKFTSLNFIRSFRPLLDTQLYNLWLLFSIYRDVKWHRSNNADKELCKIKDQEDKTDFSVKFRHLNIKNKYWQTLYYKIICEPNYDVLNAMKIKNQINCVPNDISYNSHYAYGCKAERKKD